jgi:hypothetical protein
LDLVELVVGIRADGLNGTEAHDNNQRQHDGIFDSGRAIFRNQELLYERCEVLHGRSSRLLRQVRLAGLARQQTQAIAASSNDEYRLGDSQQSLGRVLEKTLTINEKLVMGLFVNIVCCDSATWRLKAQSLRAGLRVCAGPC